MYHLRLTKGKSYWGIVRATEKQPDVYVSEKEKADRLITTGHFTLIDDGMTDSAGAAPDKDDTKEPKEPVKEESGVNAGDSLAEMSVDELKAYAELNGISLAGAKKKAEILEAIREAEAKAAEARKVLREQ